MYSKLPLPVSKTSKVHTFIQEEPVRHTLTLLECTSKSPCNSKRAEGNLTLPPDVVTSETLAKQRAVLTLPPGVVTSECTLPGKSRCYLQACDQYCALKALPVTPKWSDFSIWEGLEAFIGYGSSAEIKGQPKFGLGQSGVLTPAPQSMHFVLTVLFGASSASHKRVGQAQHTCN